MLLQPGYGFFQAFDGFDLDDTVAARFFGQLQHSKDVHIPFPQGKMGGFPFAVVQMDVGQAIFVVFEKSQIHMGGGLVVPCVQGQGKARLRQENFHGAEVAGNEGIVGVFDADFYVAVAHRLHAGVAEEGHVFQIFFFVNIVEENPLPGQGDIDPAQKMEIQFCDPHFFCKFNGFHHIVPIDGGNLIVEVEGVHGFVNMDGVSDVVFFLQIKQMGDIHACGLILREALVDFDKFQTEASAELRTGIDVFAFHQSGHSEFDHRKISLFFEVDISIAQIPASVKVFPRRFCEKRKRKRCFFCKGKSIAFLFGICYNIGKNKRRKFQMGRIGQGEFPIFTTKEDAIGKFRQMQGICRNQMSDDERIEFLCSRRGRIRLGEPSSRRGPQNPTELFGKVIAREGKTFVTYRTSFSGTGHASNLVASLLGAAVTVFGIVFAVSAKEPAVTLAVLILCLGFWFYQLLVNLQKPSSASADSYVLIKELERRVDAVNHWNE